jgi:hypothetical protein
MLRRTSSVVASLAATATLAAGLSVGLAAPAQASPQGDAAGWTLGELGKDRLFTTTFDGVDYVDHGLTIDAGLAFAELGQDRPTRQVRRALAPEMGEYAGFGASAVAKGLAWSQVSGADPRSYGGVDWVTRLEGHTGESGRITDDFGDGNTIGQAFAVQGLWEAGSSERQAALRFLLEQQCSRGFFRLSFSPADAADQSCGASGDSTPSVDVTALAVLALDTLPRRNATAREAVTDAKRWLRRQQADDGSFGGGVGTSDANANSTGLAARALGTIGACAPAAEAARWVRTVQVRGKVRRTAYVRGDKGAVAYDRAAYRQGRKTDGITQASRDQFRRATTQAAAGLRFRRGC